MKANLLIVCAGLAVLSSCGNQGKQPTIYVVVPASKMAAEFPTELARLVKQHGLEPHLGHATDDHGITLRVLEANGEWIRLWSQNVDLSGHESPLICGTYDEPHPDPGQYVVYASSELGPLNERGATKLISGLEEKLVADGYDVRRAPVLCSAFSKQEQPSRR
jgi:hypothetical protein